jgi:protein-L-isoaspartate(D-aspartate) O-methyltransferase
MDAPGDDTVTRDAEGNLAWHHPRTSDRQEVRDRMVATLTERVGRADVPLDDEVVLEAMRAVPRHAFVPRRYQRHAYLNSPVPIGHGQTISQPFIVALMTHLLEIQPGDRILEIGTGSGYQAAVLTEFTPYVFSVEIVKALHEQATGRFLELGYATIRTRQADGYDGWAEHAPFDGIIVTCASGHVPSPLFEQLKPGGRIVIPIGGVHEVQRLLVITKEADGTRSSRNVLPVRFVPMVGKSESK